MHDKSKCGDCLVGIPITYCTNGHENHNRGDCPYCGMPSGFIKKPKLIRKKL